MTAPPPANGVEEAFRPAFAEIARRAGVSRSAQDDTFFPRDEAGCVLPYILPEQNYALVSMGTSVLSPRPVDARCPALRVYGAFATHEEAREHADVIRALDSTCSLVVVPMREWFLMPTVPACLTDKAVAHAHLMRRLDAKTRAHSEAAADFERRRSNLSDAPDADVAPPCATEEEEEMNDAEMEVYGVPKRLRTGGEVRGQSAVCMTIFPDPEHGECLVRLLGLHENYDDADAWARGVATRTVVDDDVVVGRACEWMYPNATDAASKHHYRNGELQRIMDAAERNPQAVKDYKQWKAEQDQRAADADVEEGVEEGAAATE